MTHYFAHIVMAKNLSVRMGIEQSRWSVMLCDVKHIMHIWSLTMSELNSEQYLSHLQVRAFSPGVVVLFYCLDPDYPGLPIIEALDVDGYLTNRYYLHLYGWWWICHSNKSILFLCPNLFFVIVWWIGHSNQSYHYLLSKPYFIFEYLNPHSKLLSATC